MIPWFGFILFLGTTVLADTGNLPLCSLIQEDIFTSSKTPTEEVTSATSSNFDRLFNILRSLGNHHSGQEHVYFVSRIREDDNLPSINLDGKDYELRSFDVVPLDPTEGTGVWQVTFAHSDEAVKTSHLGSNKDSTEFVSIFVPLLTFEKNAVGLNEALNRDLDGMATLSKSGVHAAGRLTWMEPLLKRLVKLNNPVGTSAKGHKLFLTDCESVNVEALKPFFNVEAPKIVAGPPPYLEEDEYFNEMIRDMHEDDYLDGMIRDLSKDEIF